MKQMAACMMNSPPTEWSDNAGSSVPSPFGFDFPTHSGGILVYRSQISSIRPSSRMACSKTSTVRRTKVPQLLVSAANAPAIHRKFSGLPTIRISHFVLTAMLSWASEYPSRAAPHLPSRTAGNASPMVLMGTTYSPGAWFLMKLTTAGTLTTAHAAWLLRVRSSRLLILDTACSSMNRNVVSWAVYAATRTMHTPVQDIKYILDIQFPGLLYSSCTVKSIHP
mmetsp:Transcript_20586/g.57395  ORF Transcript_20586/g.57395 Transcript_20586/m.57395 type:complete len:223 (-) Transcript_20586:736-1404(-)